MRWRRTPTVDPRKGWRSRWHWKFAWLPVLFEYGTPEPRIAWLEWVLRRGKFRTASSSFGSDFWLYDYVPAEMAEKYPSQYDVEITQSRALFGRAP